ncbi:antitoxin VbhA family protein [Clavibacter nebraskensis]|nr:antitoxin VbhA family protein [Clavibacter nebraskensis]
MLAEAAGSARTPTRSARYSHPTERKGLVVAHAENAAAAEDARVREHLAFADAALALAGHEVTDPVLRAILERAARHEITSEEAIAEIRRHIQGDAPSSDHTSV